MHLRSLLLLILSGAILTAQKGSAPTSGVHPEDMDPTCKPCTDFWRYVNGGWLDKNPIPAHMASWGSIGVLNEGQQERTRTILEAAVSQSGPKQTANERRMGDYYASCMDTAAIDARGSMPLRSDLDRISAIQSLHDLNAALI